MPLQNLSLKDMSRRPLRTLLTLTSIIIGVAAVVAVGLAIDSTRNAQQSMLESVAGKSTLEILSDGQAPFDQSIIDKIREVPGVQLATGSVRRNSVMFMGQDKKVRIQLLGVAPEKDSLLREYSIAEGRELQNSEEVLMDASFAKSLNIKLSDPIKFMTRSGLREANIVGLVKPLSGSAVLQGGIVLIPLTVAQQWFRAPDRLDVVQLITDPNVPVDSIAEKIRAFLPEGLSISEPVLRNELGREASTTTDQGLRLASAFSLIIAIFIIYNTFQMNVGERRRQIGILRALGTTRDQIVKMIVSEGLLLGIVGTIIGCVLGWIAARSLAKASGQLLDLSIDSPGISFLPFLIGGACGILVAVVGAYFPAKRASRLSPSEAMRSIAAGELEPTSYFLIVAGVIISAVGLLILIACIKLWIHIDYAIPGCVMFLLGGIVALPTMLETFTTGLLWLIGKPLGIEGRLAQRQLLKNRGRSSLTIGILFIALSTGLGMAWTILDNIRDVRDWYENALLGDYFLRASMPSMATGQAADMPLGLMDEVRKIEGVRDVESLRFVSVRSDQLSVVVVAREFGRKSRKFFDLRDGDPDEVFDGLQNGEVVIGSVLAERAKLGIGDTITLETQEGPVTLKIAGTANDYIAAGLTVYMTRTQAEKLLHIEGTDAIIIDAKPGQIETIGKELKPIAERAGLLLQSQTDLISVVRTKIDSVVSGLWIVLALGSIIAAFGLVNTLTMNILEQTYEIGMLRAVAMTRGQVRLMVLSQAILMGLIGLIPAVLAGSFIAYLLTLSNGPTTGHAVVFAWRPWLIVLTFFGELLIVIIASLIPAERAARLKIAKAMQYQ